MADCLSTCLEEECTLIDLQHPEILTCTQLCNLFQKWRIPVTECQNTDKSKLLELYYRTIMPLPQREFKPNRRGQLLNSKREKLLRKRKSSTSDILQAGDSQQKLSKTENTLGSPKVSSESKSSHNRITFERKTIKLNTSSFNGASPTTTTTTARKTESPDSSSSQRNKIIKLINKTITSNKNGSTSSSPSLKNSTSSCKRPETSSTNETLPPKKKHKPITWP